MRCITANVLQTKVDAQCDKRVICIQTTSHPTKYEFDFPSLFRASRLLFTGLKLGVLSHEWGEMPRVTRPQWASYGLTPLLHFTFTLRLNSTLYTGLLKQLISDEKQQAQLLRDFPTAM